MTCYINLVVTPIAIVVLSFPTNPPHKTSSLNKPTRDFFSKVLNSLSAAGNDFRDFLIYVIPFPKPVSIKRKTLYILV
jgi:hypothetical protein